MQPVRDEFDMREVQVLLRLSKERHQMNPEMDLSRVKSIFERIPTEWMIPLKSLIDPRAKADFPSLAHLIDSACYFSRFSPIAELFEKESSAPSYHSGPTFVSHSRAYGSPNGSGPSYSSSSSSSSGPSHSSSSSSSSGPSHSSSFSRGSGPSHFSSSIPSTFPDPIFLKREDADGRITYEAVGDIVSSKSTAMNAPTENTASRTFDAYPPQEGLLTRIMRIFGCRW